MKESIYMNEQLAILNFSASNVRYRSELLNSPDFRNVTELFIESLKTKNKELYRFIVNGKTIREAKVEVIKCFRMLSVFDCDEIEHHYLENKPMLLKFIEEFYNFWKQHQRYSVSYVGKRAGENISNFVINDSDFNHEMNIEETIKNYESGWQLVLFWIGWVILTGLLVFVFIYIDNHWLEDN